VKRPRPLNQTQSLLLGRVRQRGTKPELTVASALRQLDLSYRKNVKDLPGSPDFANKSRKWAVFVNGCFWHRHRGCPRATIPTNNREFWLDKFARNRRRDAEAIRSLRRQGYKVVVLWECDADHAADRLSKVFESRRVDVRHPVDH
jgi:DNA mismatch endonuclease, patch repair protein